VTVATDEQVAAFGHEVRRRRLELGWTLDDLAEAAGLPPNFIGGVENGRRNPSLTTMARIAKGLGVHLTDLLGIPELNPEAVGAARLLMALPGEVRAPVVGAVSGLVAWAMRDRT
jgi:transcriptional regulator with XRE-family HTH domain